MNQIMNLAVFNNVCEFLPLKDLSNVVGFLTEYPYTRELFEIKRAKNYVREIMHMLDWKENKVGCDVVYEERLALFIAVHNQFILKKSEDKIEQALIDGVVFTTSEHISDKFENNWDDEFYEHTINDKNQFVMGEEFDDYTEYDIDETWGVGRREFREYKQKKKHEYYGKWGYVPESEWLVDWLDERELKGY